MIDQGRRAGAAVRAGLHAQDRGAVARRQGIGRFGQPDIVIHAVIVAQLSGRAVSLSDFSGNREEVDPAGAIGLPGMRGW